jgi:hypothetical protein
MTENPAEAHGEPKLLFFECIGGVSGDMCLGALLDLGFPEEALVRELSRLGLDEYFKIAVEPCTVGVIHATRVRVQLTCSDDHPRQLPQIREIIEQSTLPESTQSRSLRVFEHLAQAEAAVHRTSAEEVHFHEVGGVDALVDIVGTCIAIDYFAPEEIWYSPMMTGRGQIECAHGVIPVPAPAVMNLAVGSTLKYLDVYGELTTPTGAAILTTLGKECRALRLRLERVGYGSGHRETPGVLNLLRVSLGTGAVAERP